MTIPSAMRSRVPLAAVLLGERHDAAVRSGAAAATGVVEEHQGEQPVDLGVVRQRGELRVSRIASAARSTSPE